VNTNVTTITQVKDVAQTQAVVVSKSKEKSDDGYFSDRENRENHNYRSDKHSGYKSDRNSRSSERQSRGYDNKYDKYDKYDKGQNNGQRRSRAMSRERPSNPETKSFLASVNSLDIVEYDERIECETLEGIESRKEEQFLVVVRSVGIEALQTKELLCTMCGMPTTRVNKNGEPHFKDHHSMNCPFYDHRRGRMSAFFVAKLQPTIIQWILDGCSSHGCYKDKPNLVVEFEAEIARCKAENEEKRRVWNNNNGNNNSNNNSNRPNNNHYQQAASGYDRR